MDVVSIAIFSYKFPDTYDFISYVEFFNANPYEDLEDACNEIWQMDHHLGEYTGQKAYDFEQLLSAIIEGPQPVDPEQRKSLILKFWGPKPVDYDFSNYLHL